MTEGAACKNVHGSCLSLLGRLSTPAQMAMKLAQTPNRQDINTHAKLLLPPQAFIPSQDMQRWTLTGTSLSASVEVVYHTLLLSGIQFQNFVTQEMGG